MRRELSTMQALRVAPMVGATWADSASPESAPNGSATGHAFPAVFGAGAPFAIRAIDFSFVFHNFALGRTICPFI